MTKDRAIQILKKIKETATGVVILSDGKIKAIDMAIESLSAEPSGDLISREEALDVVCKELQYQEENRIPYDSYDSGTCYGLKTARELLLALPSADRQKGEWIENDALGWKCSKCGIITNIDSNFCPNCGADMRPEI